MSKLTEILVHWWLNFKLPTYISNLTSPARRGVIWSDCSQSIQTNVTYDTQKTRHVHPVLVQCWASVADGGPTLN